MKLGIRCKMVRRGGITYYYHRDGWTMRYVYDNGLGERWLDNAQRYHREDGPAIIWENGEHAWYIHGVHYDKQQHSQILKAKQDGIASNIASVE